MTTVRVTALKEQARVVNFATILPLINRTARPALLLPREKPEEVRIVRTARRAAGVLRLAGRAPGGVSVTPITPQRLSIPRAAGLISRAAAIAGLETIGVAELDLPPGMPRYANAATLKRMLKAKRSDVLLKRTGDRWEICDDSLQIDLLDDSVEFRLGAVQIFS